MKRTLFVLTALAAASAHAAERHHGAHEHGVAHMDVAVDGNYVDIAFRSPAMNIVGFEHEPGNAAQHDAVDAARDTLGSGDWLVLSPDAQCELTLSEVITEGLGEDHGHDDHHADEEHHDHGHDDHGHDEHEDSHADFQASYRFECEKADALETLTVNLFDDFPGTEHIEVQLIGPQGQSGQELSADQRELSL